MNVYPLPSRFSNEGLILPDVVRVDTVVVGNVVVVPVGLVERGVIVMSTSRGGKSVVSGSNPFVVFGGDVVVVLSAEVVNVVAAVIVAGHATQRRAPEATKDEFWNAFNAMSA